MTNAVFKKHTHKENIYIYIYICTLNFLDLYLRTPNTPLLFVAPTRLDRVRGVAPPHQAPQLFRITPEGGGALLFVADEPPEPGDPGDPGAHVPQ